MNDTFCPHLNYIKLDTQNMNSSADNISANVLFIDANNLNKPAEFHKDKIQQAIYTVMK